MSLPMILFNYPSLTGVDIKAGVRARGVEVGVPRRPGRDVGASDRERLERIIAGIAQLEEETSAELRR